MHLLRGRQKLMINEAICVRPLLTLPLFYSPRQEEMQIHLE